MTRRPPRSPLFPYTPLSRPHKPPRPQPNADFSDRHNGGNKNGEANRSADFLLLHRAVHADTRGQLRNVRDIDRKSTRLNSSHLVISYAVFCLKKKKEIDNVVRSDVRLESIAMSGANDG